MARLKCFCATLCTIIFLQHNFIQIVSAANILFFHQISSYSHRVVTYPLADALEKRGHSVTYISPFYPRGPYINPNITEIVPKKMADSIEAFLSNDFDINFRIHKELPNNVFAFYPTGIKTCQDLLESEELEDYFQKTKKLDLLIIDNCVSECGMVFAYKYGAKHITFSTVTMIPTEYDIFGLIPESSAIPEMELYAFQTPMTFMERVKNSITSIFFRSIHYMWYMKHIDQLVRKRLGFQDMPLVDDLYRNTSLVLSMGDMVSDYSRSLPRLFVPVGGIHCKEGRDELPLELKRFVEGDGVEGIVYISLGSLVVSSNLPEEMKSAFFQTIESFPKLRFIWKWNGEFPKKYPGNLRLGTWFPQPDILAHPKIKAFITQSGRPSSIEAVCAAVPMIAFPVMGDQDLTANRMNEMGGNIKLELGNFTKEQLQAALETAIYDKRMKERMLELKNILDDQPMSPLETAVWWTEYVLRHKDTSHLQPAGFHQYFYERRGFDMLLFLFCGIFILLAVIICITIFIVKILRNMICKQLKSSEIRENSNTLKKKD